MEHLSTAALYIRVSTEEQATEGQSVDAQIDILTQYCKLYNIQIYNTYQDLGISGKDTKNRPGLMKMLQEARQGRFNMVLVWKISRLSRSLKDLLMILDELEKYQIIFSSYSEKFDTSTPVGKMTLQLLGSIAEFERNTIIDNVKLGLQEYAKKGGKTGTVLGYDNIDKQLSVNRDEAELVKLIYKLYTINGLSMAEIADKLNRLGYKTKRNNSFGKDAISVILSNPVYLGVNRHKVGKNDEYQIKGTHQPIIDAATWNAAQRIRDENTKKRRQRSPAPFLLTGKILCPQCSHPMRGFTSNAANRSYRYYRCNHCGSICNAEKINSVVLKSLSVVLLKESITEAVIDHASRKMLHSSFDRGNAFSKKELEKANNLMDKYAMLLNKEEFSSSSILISKIKELELKIKTLQNNDTQDSTISIPQAFLLTRNDYIDMIQKYFDMSQSKNIKCIIDAAVKSIELNSDKTLKCLNLKFDSAIIL